MLLDESAISPGRQARAVFDRLAVGRLVRVARHRARKRQCDVAVDAGVGRNTVMEVENGDLDRVRLGELVAIGACLDLRLMLDWRSKRADLHAVTDTGHAAFVEAVVRFLTGSGWICHVEALSGSGSIDVLAFHAASRSLLVVEVKTRIVDIQRTLREIGYRAAAARVAAEKCGWDPRTVSTLLAISATTDQRRLVMEHAAIFGSVFALRGWDARHWLDAPQGSKGLLLFVPKARGRDLIHADSVRVHLDKGERARRASSATRTERRRAGGPDS